MSDIEQTVFIVDDDSAVRDSLRILMKSVGVVAQTYDSAQAFLDGYSDDRAGCLVLDIRMPGMSGLDLQEALNQRHAIIPIIFITGHGDVPMAVQAMQGGAVEFVQKPFRDQELLDHINTALEHDAENRVVLGQKHLIEERLSQLTPREGEVMDMVVEGKANKVIAADLDVSQRTVEIHRSRIMEKMECRSLAQLVRMVMQLES